ncbi:hypothetical protein [Pseudoxanthomonas indica]|uniref:Aspartyl protease n=1 Tax=Pseudoxanthomonas indica TaxID=428993 RepID=A0A1T5LJQ4_9GAMM|nr:hypothetical protein [Pseudoxanthomonas indica]GGD35666.1 hypothetical protein GCM10007235_04600 [Pseudoxanthomonas indica]SKC75859.1 hypothetical protein SAMN06296058_2585 [Pseudoxanthomonas indica]
MPLTLLGRTGGLLLWLSTAPVLAQVLPARFEADRVYLQASDGLGQELRLYTDTGGGLFIKQAAVERLKLISEPLADPLALREVGDRARTTRLPTFALAAFIPPPLADGGRMMVLPAELAGRQLPGTSDDDGMLGQAWFDGRIWTWDYPGQVFRLELPGWKPTAEARRLPLGFKTDAQGQRQAAFPRMQVGIAGKTYSLLLDTGAMTVLNPSALIALGEDGPAERATSMIADSVFRAWRKAHPEWRVIEDAQAGMGSAMIEVPEVIIAGYKVGPVWFTHREDRNFHDFMSSFMDARVDGALGGNAFRHFVMTVDYPGAAAYFRCANCKRAPPVTP